MQNFSDIYKNYLDPDFLLNPPDSDSEGNFTYIENKEIFQIKPEEGDIFFFYPDLMHSPTMSPNSNEDRIVIAGNITTNFETKKELV